MHNLAFLFYPTVLFLFSLYSYAQVVPNLVLSSHPLFWQFQQSLWQLGYHQRPLSTLIYLSLIAASFIGYWWVLRQVRLGNMRAKQLLIQLALCLLALLPAYPALSSDVFNYLMNAKMMHLYQASPYEHAAWDFPDEPWLSFMMNVHTVTPYGYVWTGLGYLTYRLAWGDLQLGILAFRLLGIAATLAVGWSIWVISPRDKLWRAAFFLLSPLVLLEAVGNTHNDMTMMAFMLVGIAGYFHYQKTDRIKAIILVALGWVLSVLTKLVTVVLPIVLLGHSLLKRRLPQFNAADYGAWLLILAMFADGAKRFFSWYILWAFCLAPLAKSSFTRRLLTLFSLTALLSYNFFLYLGEYSQQSELWRVSLLFSLPLCYSFYRLVQIIRNRSAVVTTMSKP